MAGPYLDRVLNKNRISLDAYYEIKMLNNSPKGVAPKPLMRLNWEQEITPDIINSMLKKVDLDIQDIKNRILMKENNVLIELRSKSRGIKFLMTKLLWYMSERSNPKLNFLLDESCIGCGTCEAVCTSGRIRIKDGKPVWIKDECNYCYACFNYCPEQAIGVKYYTKKLGRYHHPNITSKDIAEQKW